jgi:hypothetical protein
MMKRILFILFVLTTYTASAQWTIINGNQRFAKGLGIPTKDTFNTYTLADTSQIVLRPQDSSLYVHYKGRWQKVGSGSSLTVDTSSLSNRINLKLDSLKRIKDTVYGYKNGVAYFQYKDSIGGGSGGVGTLQQVTDLGNTTTNAINIISNINNGVGVRDKIILKDNNATNTDSVYIQMITNYADGIGYNPYNRTEIRMDNGILQGGIVLDDVDGEIYVSDPISGILSSINQSGVRIVSGSESVLLQKNNLSFINGWFASPSGGIDITPIYPTVDNYFTHPHKIYTPLTVTGIYNDTLATLRNVRAGGGSGTTTDTSSLSNRINLKLDSLKRSSDSVYGYKNGTRYFQFKDSIGTNPAPSGYYGAFSDTLSQSVPNSTTAAPMYFRLTDTSNGVSMQGGNRIVFAHTGIYNIQFSVQLQNTDNQLQDVKIWLKKNGTDIVGSTGFVSVPNSHGSENGHTLPSWNFVLGMVAGDSLVWYWTATSTAVTIHKYPIGSNPTSPSTASTVLTVTQQAGIMAGTGITAINGLTSEAQTFAVDSSNSTFKITSTGSTHKFNIPNASASGVTRGLISNTDYTTFNSKLSASDTANMLTPYLRKIDTANLQSKTLAAYSFQANKTYVNATATANTFKDTTGSYTGTPTWTGGTAPTTMTNAVFYYTQVGKQVTLRITMIYTNTGATNTRVQIPLTSNIPTPATPSGYSSTTDIINFGSGYFGNNASTYVSGSVGNALTFLRGTATGAEIVIDRSSSGAGKYVWATISYFTN